MMNAAADVSWLERNQEFLTAEFERLKRRLGAAGDVARDDRRAWEAAPPPALECLTRLAGLTSFERDVLVLCAGIEMDSDIAALCGHALGYSRPACATFGLALGALPEAHWSALTPERPLRRFRLIGIESGHGLTSAPLRIDERVLHYLAGINTLDPGLKPLVHAGPDAGWITPTHSAVASEAARVLDACRNNPPLIHLCGDDPQGQEDVAAAATEAAGVRLFVVRAADLPAAAELDQFTTRWQREALLLDAALLIQCAPDGATPSACRVAEELPGIVLLASREPARLSRAFLRFDVDKPKPAEQKRLWEVALGPAAQASNGTVDALAGQFRLSTRTILATGALAAQDHGLVKTSDLWNICRTFSRPRLEDLAQRLVPSAGWDDLVLPELQMTILRQLASQVRRRLHVYETWGFSAKGRRGLGVSALFAGESGVGKTLAAEVLARDLALDLYRVDVAAVVSKYIGETSKNLRQVFDAAEEGGALLLFDEADALFGKRGEVKDSHDRYANIDVSYLLQRMEAYQGLAILTTNMKTAVDRAFQRRLRFTVNFPFPDAAQREAIWSRVFPRETPTEGLDYKKLAQLNVAGGNIRNIALNAAFMAAEAGTAVGMSQALNAARLEAQKLDRALSEAEIRGWV